MKRIIAVATFEAHVPDDMTVSQVQDLVEENITDNYNRFSINVQDYKDVDNAEPYFDLDSVICGTESMISVGGD